MLLNSVLVLSTITIYTDCDAYGFSGSFLARNQLASGKEYGDQSKHYDNDGSNKKYYVSNNQIDWYDARKACRERGMRLACTPTPADKRNLIDYLRENSLEPFDKYSGYWIGGYRYTSFSPFLWDCNQQEMDLFGWYPGEPNFADEDCIEFKREEMIYGWNNHHCVLSKRFICESLPYQESQKNSVQDVNILHEEVMKASADEKNETTPKPIPTKINSYHEFIRHYLSHKAFRTTSEMPVSTQSYEHLSKHSEVTKTDIFPYSVPVNEHTEYYEENSEMTSNEGHETSSVDTTSVVTETEDTWPTTEEVNGTDSIYDSVYEYIDPNY